MTIISPISSNFQSHTDTKNNLLIMHSERFEWCALLLKNSKRILGSAKDVQMDGADFTSSLWINVEDISTTVEFVVGANGWSLGENGKIQLLGSTPANETLITTGNWHHVCWVKTHDKQSLYVDGKVVSTIDSGFSVNSGDDVTFETGDHSIKLAHQNNYARALSAPEVLVDHMMYFEPATQSFNEHYPLDVNVENITGQWEHYPDNKLFVIDKRVKDRENVKQQLTIKNITRKAIVLKAKQSASASNYHFELRLRNAAFCEPMKNPVISDSHWHIYRSEVANTEDGSWSIYMSYKMNLRLDAGESIALDYEYSSADGSLGERSTHLLLTYKDLAYEKGGSIVGERNKRLDILNMPSNIVYPLCVSYSSTQGITVNNKDLNNDLSIYVYNRSEEEICFSEVGNIRIKIPFGSSASDFADSHNETGNVDSSDRGDNKLNFIKSTDENNNLSLFLWKPTATQTIAAQSFVKLVITGFTPNSERGTAFVDVEFNGIDGHGDTTLSLAIPKVDCNLANLVGHEDVGLFTNDPKDCFHVAKSTYIGDQLTADSLVVDKNSEIKGDLSVNGKLSTSTLHINNTLAVSNLHDGNDRKPIIFKEYRLPDDTNYDMYYTNDCSPDEYTAAIVGFNSGNADIDEIDSHNMLKLQMIEDSGYWAISAVMGTHNNSPDWTIKVMFVSRQLSDGYE